MSNSLWKTEGTPLHDPLTYTCDNRRYPFDSGQNSPDSYVCACGSELSVISPSGMGRFSQPWQADFGRRCNLIFKESNRFSKGNFTGANPTDGVCLNAAVSHGDTSILYTDRKVSARPANTILDGMGVAYACNGREQDNLLCNCQTSLPQTAFGRRIATRNPCSLEESIDKVPIAVGATFGGLGLAVSIWVAFFLWKRRANRTQRMDTSFELASRSAGDSSYGATDLVLRQSLTPSGSSLDSSSISTIQSVSTAATSIESADPQREMENSVAKLSE